MSFSSSVKDELSRQVSGARHCQIAGAAAILSLYSRVKMSASDHFWIEIRTENVAVVRKYFTLLKRTFNIRTDISIRSGMSHGRSRTYIVAVREYEEALKALQTVKLINTQREVGESLSLTRNVVLQNACCRRAFIRDAFLATGSISAPEKFYHLEIICPAEPRAERLKNVTAAFDIEAKIVPGKRYYVIYIKESSQIVDVPNVMETPVSLMELENVRVVKEMRGGVNRQVNCEAANINKAVSAAVKQIEDIRFIQSVAGLSGLPKSLQEMIHIRLERPEATLKGLGEAPEPPAGESDVNHRLRKLSLVAEELRQQYPDRNTSSLQQFYQVRISTGI